MKNATHPILSVEDLHVQIGKRMVLHDISFSVHPKEIVGIIGPNGCGKTTLLNAVSGFLPVDAGTISFDGNDIMHLEPYRRARAGIARSFQHFGVFKEMTVEENLMVAVEQAENYPWWWSFAPSYRQAMAERISRALNQVNLADHRQSLAGILSGGQLRLLELARIQLSKSKLLLIDEPTAGVAPVLRQELSRVIRTMVEEHGHTAVIVEHDLDFLFNLADRVVVLVDGEKYLEGTPEEIKRDERLKKVYFGERT